MFTLVDKIKLAGTQFHFILFLLVTVTSNETFKLGISEDFYTLNNELRICDAPLSMLQYDIFIEYNLL